MYLISTEGYKNAGVDLLIIKKTRDIWTKMKDVQDGLAVQMISGLVLKEIYGIYKTLGFTKEQIIKYKMTKREDSEITECPEYSKNILLRFMKLILIFISITEKRYMLIKMGVNIYYLELMFILLNIS